MNFLPEKASQDDFSESIKDPGAESETAWAGLARKLSEYTRNAQATKDGISGSLSAKWKQARDAVKSAYDAKLGNGNQVEENMKVNEQDNVPDINYKVLH